MLSAAGRAATTSPVKPVLAALRTLLVLAACIASIGLVAYFIGELPPRDAVERRRTIAARETREATRHEAERRRLTSPVVVADAAVADAGPPPVPRTPRSRACDDARDASLDRIRLDARGRELIAVSCGDALDVLGFVGETPVSVARIAPASIDQTAPVRAFHIASDDVTGDGAIDWVVGTVRSVDATSPAVGSLHVVPGDSRGGLGEPILLAPLAVAALDLGRVDDDDTIDIAVLHRPDPTAARAPEAWVFRGGASPVRLSRVPLGREAQVLVLADVDADGFADLVPSGRDATGLAMLGGDGHGLFARRIELALPAATHLLRYVEPPAGVRVLFGGPVPSRLEAAPTVPRLAGLALPANPFALDVRTADRAVVVGLLEGGVARLFDIATATPTSLGTVTIANEAGRIVDLVVGDFAGSADPDVVLLVERAGTTRERDLVVRLDVLTTAGAAVDETITLADERDTVARGPLHLTIPLR